MSSTNQNVLSLAHLVADPYPFYEIMRSPAPTFAAPLDLWVVTSFRTASEILRDRRFVAFSPRRWEAAPDAENESALRRLETTIERQLMYLGAADHVRLRALVSEPFSPRSIERSRHVVTTIVDTLLQRAAEDEVTDLVQTVAGRLPVEVSASLLGLRLDRDILADWARRIARGVDLLIDPDVVHAANTTFAELDTYVREEIAAVRREPREDLLTKLVRTDRNGAALSDDEIVSLCGQLLGAYETTMNLICNSLVALSTHPAQRVALENDRELIPQVVEETLRYESPVQMTSRRALQDVEIAGTELEAGAEVAVLIAAANRDPHEFVDAASFDIARDDVKHLSFGHGPHVCLGAALARLEAQTTLTRLMDCYPQWQLVEEHVEWRPSVTLRGPTRLRVALQGQG